MRKASTGKTQAVTRAGLSRLAMICVFLPAVAVMAQSDVSRLDIECVLGAPLSDGSTSGGGYKCATRSRSGSGDKVFVNGSLEGATNQDDGQGPESSSGSTVVVLEEAATSSRPGQVRVSNKGVTSSSGAPIAGKSSARIGRSGSVEILDSAGRTTHRDLEPQPLPPSPIDAGVIAVYGDARNGKVTIDARSTVSGVNSGSAIFVGDAKEIELKTDGIDGSNGRSAGVAAAFQMLRGEMGSLSSMRGIIDRMRLGSSASEPSVTIDDIAQVVGECSSIPGNPNNPDESGVNPTSPFLQPPAFDPSTQSFVVGVMKSEPKQVRRAVCERRVSEEFSLRTMCARPPEERGVTYCQYPSIVKRRGVWKRPAQSIRVELACTSITPTGRWTATCSRKAVGAVSAGFRPRYFMLEPSQDVVYGMAYDLLDTSMRVRGSGPSDAVYTGNSTAIAAPGALHSILSKARTILQNTASDNALSWLSGSDSGRMVDAKATAARQAGALVRNLTDTDSLPGAFSDSHAGMLSLKYWAGTAQGGRTAIDAREAKSLSARFFDIDLSRFQGSGGSSSSVAQFHAALAAHGFSIPTINDAIIAYDDVLVRRVGPQYAPRQPNSIYGIATSEEGVETNPIASRSLLSLLESHSILSSAEINSALTKVKSQEQIDNLRNVRFREQTTFRFTGVRAGFALRRTGNGVNAGDDSGTIYRALSHDAPKKFALFLPGGLDVKAEPTAKLCKTIQVDDGSGYVIQAGSGLNIFVGPELPSGVGFVGRAQGGAKTIGWNTSDEATDSNAQKQTLYGDSFWFPHSPSLMPLKTQNLSAKNSACVNDPANAASVKMLLSQNERKTLDLLSGANGILIVGSTAQGTSSTSCASASGSCSYDITVYHSPVLLPKNKSFAVSTSLREGLYAPEIVVNPAKMDGNSEALVSVPSSGRSAGGATDFSGCSKENCNSNYVQRDPVLTGESSRVAGIKADTSISARYMGVNSYGLADSSTSGLYSESPAKNHFPAAGGVSSSKASRARALVPLNSSGVVSVLPDANPRLVKTLSRYRLLVDGVSGVVREGDTRQYPGVILSQSIGRPATGAGNELSLNCTTNLSTAFSFPTQLISRNINSMITESEHRAGSRFDVNTVGRTSEIGNSLYDPKSSGFPFRFFTEGFIPSTMIPREAVTSFGANSFVSPLEPINVARSANAAMAAIVSDDPEYYKTSSSSAYGAVSRSGSLSVIERVPESGVVGTGYKPTAAQTRRGTHPAWRNALVDTDSIKERLGSIGAQRRYSQPFLNSCPVSRATSLIKNLKGETNDAQEPVRHHLSKDDFPGGGTSSPLCLESETTIPGAQTPSWLYGQLQDGQTCTGACSSEFFSPNSANTPGSVFWSHLLKWDPKASHVHRRFLDSRSFVMNFLTVFDFVRAASDQSNSPDVLANSSVNTRMPWSHLFAPVLTKGVYDWSGRNPDINNPIADRGVFLPYALTGLPIFPSSGTVDSSLELPFAQACKTPGYDCAKYVDNSGGFALPYYGIKTKIGLASVPHFYNVPKRPDNWCRDSSDAVFDILFGDGLAAYGGGWLTKDFLGFSFLDLAKTARKIDGFNPVKAYCERKNLPDLACSAVSFDPFAGFTATMDAICGTRDSEVEWLKARAYVFHGLQTMSTLEPEEVVPSDLFTDFSVLTDSHPSSFSNLSAFETVRSTQGGLPADVSGRVRRERLGERQFNVHRISSSIFSSECSANFAGGTVISAPLAVETQQFPSGLTVARDGGVYFGPLAGRFLEPPALATEFRPLTAQKTYPWVDAANALVRPRDSIVQTMGLDISLAGAGAASVLQILSMQPSPLTSPSGDQGFVPLDGIQRQNGVSSSKTVKTVGRVIADSFTRQEAGDYAFDYESFLILNPEVLLAYALHGGAASEDGGDVGSGLSNSLGRLSYGEEILAPFMTTREFELARSNVAGRASFLSNISTSGVPGPFFIREIFTKTDGSITVPQQNINISWRATPDSLVGEVVSPALIHKAFVSQGQYNVETGAPGIVSRNTALALMINGVTFGRESDATSVVGGISNTFFRREGFARADQLFRKSGSEFRENDPRALSTSADTSASSAGVFVEDVLSVRPLASDFSASGNGGLGSVASNGYGGPFYSLQAICQGALFDMSVTDAVMSSSRGGESGKFRPYAKICELGAIRKFDVGGVSQNIYWTLLDKVSQYDLSDPAWTDVATPPATCESPDHIMIARNFNANSSSATGSWRINSSNVWEELGTPPAGVDICAPGRPQNPRGANNEDLCAVAFGTLTAPRCFNSVEVNTRTATIFEREDLCYNPSTGLSKPDDRADKRIPDCGGGFLPTVVHTGGDSFTVEGQPGSGASTDYPDAPVPYSVFLREEAVDKRRVDLEVSISGVSEPLFIQDGRLDFSTGWIRAPLQGGASCPALSFSKTTGQMLQGSSTASDRLPLIASRQESSIESRYGFNDPFIATTPFKSVFVSSGSESIVSRAADSCDGFGGAGVMALVSTPVAKPGLATEAELASPPSPFDMTFVVGVDVRPGGANTSLTTRQYTPWSSEVVGFSMPGEAPSCSMFDDTALIAGERVFELPPTEGSGANLLTIEKTTGEKIALSLRPQDTDDSSHSNLQRGFAVGGRWIKAGEELIDLPEDRNVRMATCRFPASAGGGAAQCDEPGIVTTIQTVQGYQTTIRAEDGDNGGNPGVAVAATYEKPSSVVVSSRAGRGGLPGGVSMGGESGLREFACYETSRDPRKPWASLYRFNSSSVVVSPGSKGNDGRESRDGVFSGWGIAPDALEFFRKAAEDGGRH